MTRPIALIGAPSSAGAFSPGQEDAPRALRSAGIVEALRVYGLHVRDAGDSVAFRWHPDRHSPRAQHVGQVMASIAATRSLIDDAFERGEFAVVVGGDCTVGIAAMECLAARGERLGVVYLDHDADMNTPHSTSTGAVDWMTLGCALGLEGCLPGVATPGLLEAARLVLVGFDGAASTDWELAAIERLGISVVEAAKTDRDPDAAAQWALSALPSDTTAVAIHFDVDVVDFMDAPLSEDLNRNVGIRLDAAFTCLARLARDPRVRAITITELNPHHGAEDGSTLRRFIDGLVKALAGAGGIT